MEKSYTNRFNSFKNSLASLKEAKGKDKDDSFVLSGTAMKFNLTFDLAWKLMSDIIREEHKIVDYAIGSPKETLRKAKSFGIIDDDIWLNMLDDRNNLTHDYDYLIVAEKFDEIVDKYIEVFEKFRSKVDEIIREI